MASQKGGAGNKIIKILFWFRPSFLRRGFSWMPFASHVPNAMTYTHPKIATACLNKDTGIPCHRIWVWRTKLAGLGIRLIRFVIWISFIWENSLKKYTIYLIISQKKLKTVAILLLTWRILFPNFSLGISVKRSLKMSNYNVVIKHTFIK